MDVKRFKANLENNLGKRLDKISKDFIKYKIDLERAKNQLRDINKYIEGKNSCKRHSVPSTPQKVLERPLKPKEESKKKLDITPARLSKAKSKPIESPLPQESPPISKPKPKKIIMPKVPLDSILSQISEFELHYSPEILSCKTTFTVSLGAKSAFDIIKSMNKENFKLSEATDTKIIWAIGLVYKLLGEEFEINDGKALEKAQFFLADCAKSENISDYLMGKVKDFDFDDFNIDLIEEYITGQEDLLFPQIYTQISQLCGLLMVSLREALVYCGLVKGKAQVWRTYQRLLHKKSLLNSLII